MYYQYYVRVSESGFSDRRLSEPEGPGQSPEALTLIPPYFFFPSLSLSLSCSHFLSLSLLLSISPILFVCLSVHLSVGLSVFPSLSHSSIYRPLSLSLPLISVFSFSACCSLPYDHTELKLKASVLYDSN